MKPVTAAAIAGFAFSPAGAAEAALSISRESPRVVSAAPATYFTGLATVEMVSLPAGEEQRPGDVVRIPPVIEHWHGAMTRIAVAQALDGKTVEWLGPVGDEQYRVALAIATKPSANAPSRVQSAVTAAGVTRDVFTKP